MAAKVRLAIFVAEIQHDCLTVAVCRMQSVITASLNSCLLVAPQAKQKKGSVLDLTKFLDKAVRVKFSGGREGWLSHLCMCTHM